MIDAARAEELAVLDYSRRQPHVDPHRIVIVGQSVGGFVTTAMAADNPDGVVGLDAIMPEAVTLKYIAKPLTAEQVSEMVQIPPRS